MKIDVTSDSKSGGRQVPETGPWESDVLAKFREWDPVFVDQCIRMSNSPWVSNILPGKDIELISLAVNVAITNLSAGGTRRHIRGALEAGATNSYSQPGGTYPVGRSDECRCKVGAKKTGTHACL